MKLEPEQNVLGLLTLNEWLGMTGVETGLSIRNRQRLPVTTAESCNTHNMLKLTARLFEREPGAAYADYYERALCNHLLATVAPETGAMSYVLPLFGHFRTYLDEKWTPIFGPLLKLDFSGSTGSVLRTALEPRNEG